MSHDKNGVCTCSSTPNEYVLKDGKGSRADVTQKQKPMNGKEQVMHAALCTMMYNNFPNSVSITATVLDGSSVNKLRFKDACGFFDDLGIGTGANTQEMSVTGAISSDSLRKWFHTYCGRIELINYDSTNSAQLNNRINIKAAYPDEVEATVKNFDVATDRRNTQFNDELQTVRPHKGSAWWCTNTGFIVNHIPAVGEDIVTSLSIQFDKWVSYNDLYESNC